MNEAEPEQGGTGALIPCISVKKYGSAILNDGSADPIRKKYPDPEEISDNIFNDSLSIFDKIFFPKATCMSR